MEARKIVNVSVIGAWQNRKKSPDFRSLEVGISNTESDKID